MAPAPSLGAVLVEQLLFCAAVIAACGGALFLLVPRGVVARRALLDSKPTLSTGPSPQPKCTVAFPYKNEGFAFRPKNPNFAQMRFLLQRLPSGFCWLNGPFGLFW